MTSITSLIAKRTNAEEWQIKNILQLTSEGATLPFIARYRKEKTGNLDEVKIGQILDYAAKIEKIEARKNFIIEQIKEQDKLTSELRSKIENCWETSLLEDIYLPFKPSKKTKADIAIENGLDGLAKILLAQNNHSINNAASSFVKGNIKSIDDAIEGAQLIVAKWISERSYVRDKMRRFFQQNATISTSKSSKADDPEEKFKDYYDFEEPAKYAKPHRIHAVLRGNNEGILNLKIRPKTKAGQDFLKQIILKDNSSQELEDALNTCYSKILRPSLENEFINELKKKADDKAIEIFSKNLEQLLLQPPLGSYRTLAIDPGYRTGCKIVCLDSNGNLLANDTIYPNPPQREKGPAQKRISTLVEQYKIEAIAIGNGTASRETERFVKSTRFDRKLKVFVVNEAGASIYSASSIAREEFPNYDVTVRGAVSIGRRLMDPLAELVKIDPKSIGVGQYQHDVDQKELQEKLNQVVENCVNKVGVDLNTASKHLLGYVAGIGPKTADNIVEYRKENGSFARKSDLKKVSKIGDKAFEQAAGFVRIKGENAGIENSGLHPEHYPLVKSISKNLNTPIDDLIGNESLLATLNSKDYISDQFGAYTVEDVISELKNPGLDPRKNAKVLTFDESLKTIEDLKLGHQMPGIVNNITNFGAFVDFGIKENGLIHISQLSDTFISDPTEVISLHEHVIVEVVQLDIPRKRIGLKRITD